MVIGFVYPPFYRPAVALFGFMVLFSMPSLTPLLTIGIVMVFAGVMFSRTPIAQTGALLGLLLIFVANWKMGLMAAGLLFVVMTIIPLVLMGSIFSVSKISTTDDD